MKQYSQFGIVYPTKQPYIKLQLRKKVNFKYFILQFLYIWGFIFGLMLLIN